MRWKAPFLSLLIASHALAGVDLADPANRNLWLSHPVIGDVSYDTLTRSPNNPIYTGTPPYEWPVNGFLFRDPPTGDWYCYISLYPKGYWPAGPTRALRSRDQGRSWEDLGIVLQGDPNSFDGDGKQAGATLDPSVVMDSDGYHMVYGWARPDNSDGGLAYAHAKSPAGPWARDPKPIHAESAQPLLPIVTPLATQPDGSATVSIGYKRVYAGTLIRRAKDWLVLASMSTPRNAGGTWASVCLTAPDVHGPWSAPTFLRKPQDGQWLPQPVEFFPAWVHEGYVYAAHTSVALNRSYQIVFRSPVEQAHQPESWDLWQGGSLFHAEPIRSESHGIWGQALSGFVDPAGIFRVMYPARNPDNVGTINIASRPWTEPRKHGFWLSAPNGPSFVRTRRSFTDFRLEIELEAESLEPDKPASRSWRLVWNHRGPLGPDRAHAESIVSPGTLSDCSCLAISSDQVQVQRIATDGTVQTLHAATRAQSGKSCRVILEQRAGSARIQLNGSDIGPVQLPNPGGAIALMAEKGTFAHVSRFTIDNAGDQLTTTWLALEGLLGAGLPEGLWKHHAEGFRLGTGYIGAFEGARAKWSFDGLRARLWAPRGPGYGQTEVLLDGHSMGHIDLHAAEPQASVVVWESPVLETGRHAVMLVSVTGVLPVDCLDVTE